MTYSEFINRSKERLGSLYSREEATAMAARLLQFYCKISPYEHLVEPFGVINSQWEIKLNNALDELSAGRPLQYILGFEEFCRLNIVVKEGVLIPRPETEELVYWVAEFAKSYSKNKSCTGEGCLKILDAACGSGCIAAALGALLPQSHIFACDLSNPALEIADINLKGRGNIFNYNLLGEDRECGADIDLLLKETGGMLDIIVSNPPYVTDSERALMRKNVLEYEPHMALFVSNETPLIFYEALERVAKGALVKGGAIFMEINERFGNETLNIFNSGYFSHREIRRDIFGKDRMVMAIKK